MQSKAQEDILIPEITSATTKILASITDIDIEVVNVKQLDHTTGSIDVTKCMEITGMLGFSSGNTLRGSLLMTFTEPIALKIVGGMLGIELEEFDSDVTDGVGEFINMVAGGTKTRLQANGVDFERSIPNIVTGKGVQISAPASTFRSRVTFDSSVGPFFMEVSYKQE